MPLGILLLLYPVLLTFANQSQTLPHIYLISKECLQIQMLQTLHSLEVEPATMIAMCETHEYDYTIITPNDIVIPPDKKNHDLI